MTHNKNKTKQNKTKQNKTKQNKTKQNKTKQNKTKQKKKYNLGIWFLHLFATNKKINKIVIILITYNLFNIIK